MSGNVWEWTRSLWEGYSYWPGPKRENLKADAREPPVVRGGAFSNSVRLVRAADRSRSGPDPRRRNIAFRVVVSPFFSDL